VVLPWMQKPIGKMSIRTGHLNQSWPEVDVLHKLIRVSVWLTPVQCTSRPSIDWGGLSSDAVGGTGIDESHDFIAG
jgi:hypothetical protein